MRNHAPVVVLVVFAALAAVAGYRAHVAVPSYDTEVSLAVPREAVILDVDLPARLACDEAFDIALYDHPGVELVSWELGARSCRGRRVTVKYLPSRIRRAALLERIERLAVSVRVVGG